MSSLETFIYKQFCEVIDMCVDEFPSKVWVEYNLDVWKLTNQFYSFIGAEIRAFISNIPLITLFLIDNFNSNDYLASGITGLNVWQDLC